VISKYIYNNKYRLKLYLKKFLTQKKFWRENDVGGFKETIEFNDRILGSGQSGAGMYRTAVLDKTHFPAKINRNNLVASTSV